MKANKYLCVHGHFYQPPRENAWLEVVELQDSAAPFHDWNDRINYECYAPNTAARLLNEQRSITNILNNYAYISFNFGPTLLSWLEKADPSTYHGILKADQESMQRYGGHGSALAQVYSHLIMPLANAADQETQVIWGIQDFEHRFGRKPEGMWLAETAADTSSLEMLAKHGIKFTILAPRQAKAIRKTGDADWQQLIPGTVDPRRPYLCKLPSGREIALFFYDGGVSQAVAFNGLLNDGDRFANALAAVFDNNDTPQLGHIATDGESYGHHHRFGEMALAKCMHQLDQRPDIHLTNYGQYLELFPPQYEAQIHENSSWSCVHGVERWRNDCGCNTGGRSDWNQGWRGPLRDTLNWLRDSLIPLYEKHTKSLLKDPWAARNEYIQVILAERNAEVLEAFLVKHTRRPLKNGERTTLLRLLEMQRHAMLMFTSCGWFFDEISGLETDQILQYANRAIYYAEQIAGVSLHQEFLERLENTPSNYYENGAVSYRKNVVPARVDLVRVGMHYAASSLFERYPEELELFNYRMDSEVFHREEAGYQRLAYGRTKLTSKITLSEKQFSFAVLYLGQHNIIGHISLDMERPAFDQLTKQLQEAFHGTDLGQVIGIMQDFFGAERFTFWHLFRDEKRKIINLINKQSLRLVETAFREIFNDTYQLMTGIRESNIPVPLPFQSAAQFVINSDLDRFFRSDVLLIRELNRLIGEVKKWEITFTDTQALELAAGERIYKEIRRLYGRFAEGPEDLDNLNEILEAIQELGLDLNLWKSQNLYWSWRQSFQELWSDPTLQPTPAWLDAFNRLGGLLGMALPIGE